MAAFRRNFLIFSQSRNRDIAFRDPRFVRRHRSQNRQIADWTSPRSGALLSLRPAFRAPSGTGGKKPRQSGDRNMTKTKPQTSTRARAPKKNKSTAEPATAKTTKTGYLVELLSQPDGASIAEMCAVTGWQSHSLRGALAGALRKKGFDVTSEVIDGTRRYRIGALS